MPKSICSVDGCNQIVRCGGLCGTHLYRWRKYGSVSKPPRPTPMERFCWKFEHDERGCWVWTARRDKDGYGEFDKTKAHRFAYEHLVGPIPEGLQLDHLCRNRACVNPQHLEPVTNRENQRRGFGISALNARKTHCKWGHPFNEENTRWVAGGTERACRICSLRHWADYRRRKATRVSDGWRN